MSPMKREIRVLCVDDSSYNLFLMKEILGSIKTLDIELDSAMHGQEALDKVLSHPKRYYHFIFLDLHMPLMNGFEV